MENKYKDEDFTIPVLYKEQVVAYTPNNVGRDITIKFIDENEKQIFGNTKNLTFVKFHTEEDSTQLSHVYILDDLDVELFNRGQIKWSGENIKSLTNKKNNE